MPSKPLFGMPVVVGMSDAVIPMRSTFSCAAAGESDRADRAISAATDVSVFMQGGSVVWRNTMQGAGRA